MSTWSTLSSAINKRWPLLALAFLPLVGWSDSGKPDLTAGLTPWGNGEYRRFGFLVYEAQLWANEHSPTQPPLALKLTYKRNIDGRDIADASVKEMRQLDLADDARLRVWGKQMEGIFPDVHPGDHILGVYLPEGARFYYNDHFAGGIDDPAFARAFFAIWLDTKTSAPDLRTALLRRPANKP